MSRAGTVVVVGAGIVGLAVADEMGRRHPGHRVVVIEKESALARHQTGRNSGVIHSGLYYRPGSAKARLCRAGAASIVELAQQEGIAHEICGKLVVATSEAEVAGLHLLAERARANGVAVTELDGAGVREREPHVSALAALHVPSTGIIDYVGVCQALARRVTDRGGEVRLGTEVRGAVRHGQRTVLETTAGAQEADLVISCAGLQSDRVGDLLGHKSAARVLPFRGEYYALRPERADLVRGLVYPVPNPELPFLGVHLTRGIDGGVHAGPNAVLALGREAYTWRTVEPRAIAELLGFPGFWRLAAANLRTGADEVLRSWSRRRFATSLRRLVPEIGDDDIVPAPAGIRAQAVLPDGRLVDDFLIEQGPGVVVVLNCPSPAATASLEIARHIVGLVGGLD